MGNYRFRLSEMMPNAWFYKLKDMGRTKNNNHSSSTNTPTQSAKNKHLLSSKAAATKTAQPSKVKQPHHHSYPRKSYYFTRELIPSDTTFRDTNFPDPPRRSSKQQKRLKRRAAIKSSSPKVISSSVSAGCSCRATIWTKSDSSSPDYSADSPTDTTPDPEFSDSFPPEFRSDRVLTTESCDDMLSSWSSSNCSKFDYSTTNDIVIDVDKKSLTKKADRVDAFDNISDIDLPPIITKPAKFDDNIEAIKSKAKKEQKNAHGSLSVKIVKENIVSIKQQKGSSGYIRRHSANSPGVRLRVNSPRIGSRRIAAAQGRRSLSSVSSSSASRRSLSESLAIVKSSFDPQRDFRDSMVEMIVENNIRASKDLEDLLACYLSLNSDEYHDLIIKVFKQIWFDLTDTKLK